MLVLNYGLASSVANSPHLVETVRQLLAFISELEALLAHLQENALTPEEARVIVKWCDYYSVAEDVMFGKTHLAIEKLLGYLGLRGTEMTDKICSKGWGARCAVAKGKRCRCKCGGENHGNAAAGLSEPMDEIITRALSNAARLQLRDEVRATVALES